MSNFETLTHLLEADRSCRRFDASVSLPESKLKALVSLTRLCASGRNMQPLKYVVIGAEHPELLKSIFPMLKWAGYLCDWNGPAEDERPTAYIVQCLDASLTSDAMCDDGLQLQVISLGATALSLGGCIVKSFNVADLIELLGLPEHIKPLYVYAMGFPKEKFVIESTLSTGGDIRYWRDEAMVHHVPKRPLNEILLTLQ